MAIVRNPPEKPQTRRQKLSALLTSQDNNDVHDDFTPRRNSDASAATSSAPGNTPMYYSNPNSAASSPYNNHPMSPWSEPSPYPNSPWIHQLVGSSFYADDDPYPHSNGLIGSLYREEGHVCSLAVADGVLYTGSDSKNVRVWKNLKELSGFKSGSGFVKAMIVFENKVFTGHHDGKIRIWKCLDNERSKHKRVGNLPRTRDLLVKSINPKNYVEVRRNHNVPWVKHYDAVSCLSVDENLGLLFSGSWDRTLKVWRISDSKCLESIHAHDDAVNSVVVAFDGLVFTGSADGTVKAWRRELVGKSTRHVLVETLLKQDHAVTSLAVSQSAAALYAGSSDGLISFWDREKHIMCYGGVLRGHKLAVLCLAVGGNLVLSGSADKSICVWRRDVGGVHSCLTVLSGHGGPVKCLAVEEEEEEEEYSDDKQWTVYSGCLDKSVKVWRVSESSLSLREIQEEEAE